MNNQTPYNAQEGDIVVKDGKKYYVMARTGSMVWLSDSEKEAMTDHQVVRKTAVQLVAEGYVLEVKE